MKLRSSAAILFIVPSFSGCGLSLTRVTPAPLQRLQPAMVDGDQMTGSVISIDNTPVGSALVPALQHPLNQRQIVVPAAVGGTTAVVAKAGPATSNTLANLAVSPTPAAPPPPVFSISGHRDSVSGQAVFYASGDYLYPGAGSPNSAYQGPSAVALNMATNATTAATETTFLFPGEFRFIFNALPTGDYKLRVTNHQIYGSQTGDSINAVQIP